ncbi:hypothetical protein CFOL_v3_15586 [Cephalotus follicularis]|uniref:Uncharacterized protein n=1 Tax=Cephalotus follicularis TaxID=3775 RepID=A0A1Q3BVS6_CEPFO|nr:hypothetical protein CFOL_v3_15586 [Cephalotus follicularis]
MLNALSGMGGGGQVDPTAANNANTALCATFVVFGIYNVLDPHLTLFAGCSTHVLYASSFLCYNHHQVPFILNYHCVEDAASVNDATYIGFMSADTLLSLGILPPGRVIRDDGTRCTNIKYSSHGVFVLIYAYFFQPMKRRTWPFFQKRCHAKISICLIFHKACHVCFSLVTVMIC